MNAQTAVAVTLEKPSRGATTSVAVTLEKPDKSAAVAIVSSIEDPAGTNIHNHLLNLFPFKQEGEFDSQPLHRHEKEPLLLARVQGRQIFADQANALPADSLLFASTHSAASKEAAVTAHPIGNWGKAELGGKPSTIVKSMPRLLGSLLHALEKQKKLLGADAFSVFMEATHHGPYVEKPCVFAELGSHEPHWKDPLGGKVVARAIMDALTGQPDAAPKVSLGVGGNHYCQHFFKGVQAHTHAFAHVCPKYALADLTEDTLNQALQATTVPVTNIVVDKKGLGSEKARVMGLLENTGLEMEFARSLGK